MYSLLKFCLFCILSGIIYGSENRCLTQSRQAGEYWLTERMSTDISVRQWVFHSAERDQRCSAPPKPEASGDASPPKMDA